MPVIRWKEILSIGWICLPGGIVSEYALASNAAADSLPAGVRACAAQSNAEQRLACYDRAVAPFIVPAEPAVQAAPLLPATTAATTAPPANAAPQRGPAAEDAPPHSATTAAAQEPRHYSAHVVSIEHAGSEDMILHLDNDQIWEQAGPASADVYLKQGDSVDINRTLGSWWLSVKNGDAVPVRRRN